MKCFYILSYIMGLNPKVWLPYLWFILYTIAIEYPKNPNDFTKKKYYTLIQNLPIYFPSKPMGSYFAKLLDKYPVTPYLGSRLSFMKWVHYIESKIKIKMEEETFEFYESLEKYYNLYKPVEMRDREIVKTRKRYIQFGLFVFLFTSIILIYRS